MPGGSSRVSLGEQIQNDKSVKPQKKKLKRKSNHNDDVGEVSMKLLSEAQAQRVEEDSINKSDFSVPQLPSKPSKKVRKMSMKSHDNSSSSEGNESNSDWEDEDGIDESNAGFELEMNEEDQKAFELMLNNGSGKKVGFQELIASNTNQIEKELASTSGSQMGVPVLDDRVIELYRGVRDVLAHYKSGKIPKAFKIIPSLANWEQILHMLEPEKWTAAAVFKATKTFTAALNERMAQRFYNVILLPRIRDDIDEYKRLNFHLFSALKKTVFRPGAFFKGILLPLCSDGGCTLREAVIVGAALRKTSIPMLHSAAAMLKIAEMDYSAANSIFLRLLIDKSYALPYQVIDGLVNHFLRFHGSQENLTVLWHQCFLSFVQIYSKDIAPEQREALLTMLKSNFHPKIGPVISSILRTSSYRDDSKDIEMMAEPIGNDHTESVECTM